MSGFGAARFDRMRQLVGGTAASQVLRPGNPGTRVTQELRPGQLADARAEMLGQPDQRDLQRLRRERELQARMAQLRRRQAGQSGDLNALESARFEELGARNELMDVGLAATGRGPVTDNIRDDVAARSGASRLRRRAALEMNADAGAALDANAFGRDTLGPLGRQTAEASARTGAEEANALMELRRRVRPVEADTTEVGANTALTDAMAAGGEADDTLAIQEATRADRRELARLQARLDREVAAGTMDDVTATQIKNAQMARIEAETAARVAETTAPGRIATAENMTEAGATRSLADAEGAAEELDLSRETAPARRATARSRAEIEAAQSQLEARMAGDSIAFNSNPDAGIIRQDSAAPDDKKVLPAVRQTIRDIATVFDQQTPGSATYQQVIETEIPRRIGEVLPAIRKLEQDANSGNPQIIASAREQAQQLLREMPLQLSGGGFRVRRRGGLIPGTPSLLRFGAVEGEARTERARQAIREIGEVAAILQRIAATP